MISLYGISFNRLFGFVDKLSTMEHAPESNFILCVSVFYTHSGERWSEFDSVELVLSNIMNDFRGEHSPGEKKINQDLV